MSLPQPAKQILKDSSLGKRKYWIRRDLMIQAFCKLRGLHKTLLLMDSAENVANLEHYV